MSTTQVAVRVPEDELAALDKAVKQGHYESRAAAIRTAIEILLRAERERQISASYKQAYGKKPQDEDWIAEAGAALGAELLQAES